VVLVLVPSLSGGQRQREVLEHRRQVVPVVCTVYFVCCYLYDFAICVCITVLSTVPGMFKSILI